MRPPSSFETAASRPPQDEVSSALLFVVDRVDEHADALDVDLAGIARLHPHRVRLARVTDTGGRPGTHDIATLERYDLGDIGDGHGDREHHIVGVVGLHDLSVESALDLQTLAAGGHLVGRDHPRAEAAGVVEILAHGPLRGLALKFAHRAFVAARISGNA